MTPDPKHLQKQDDLFFKTLDGDLLPLSQLHSPLVLIGLSPADMKIKNFIVKVASEACVDVLDKNPFQADQPITQQLLRWKQDVDVEADSHERSARLGGDMLAERRPDLIAKLGARFTDDWTDTQMENLKSMGYWILEECARQFVADEDELRADDAEKADGEDGEDGWSGMF